jgi:hypothetical protein
MCRSSPATSPNLAGVVDAASPSHSSTPASSASADTAPALSASSAGTAARSFVAVALPGSRGGIGFDDLTFASFLHRILAPAGRTGKLGLIDPATQEVALIAGFAAAEQGARGHEQGPTSADEGDGVLFAIDRTTLLLHVIDPVGSAIVASAPLAGSPDYVRWVPPTGEVWVTEPDSDRIELFSLQGRPPQAKHAGFLRVEGGPGIARRRDERTKGIHPPLEIIDRGD